MQPHDDIRLRHMLDSAEEAVKTDLPDLIKALKEIIPPEKT
jgi:hypothetical protein